MTRRAAASGIDVRRLRIVVFAVSAALAGLGGALLAQSARVFDATTFDPVQSIIWFAAVVVFGIDERGARFSPRRYSSVSTPPFTPACRRSLSARARCSSAVSPGRSCTAFGASKRGFRGPLAA